MTAALMLSSLLAAGPGPDGGGPRAAPVPVIFDTDLGNDVDDVLALGLLHALADRGECEILAVTTSKAHPLSAPFADLVNTFYGRPNVPVGAVSVGGALEGVTPKRGKYLSMAEAKNADGSTRFPHALSHDPAEVPDAVPVLRRALAGAADGSVTMVQVGFSTNLARLLESPPDDIDPRPGRDLIAAKVATLALMAGDFSGEPGRWEYNVGEHREPAAALAAGWPTPTVWSGRLIGIALPFPPESIDEDYRYAAALPNGAHPLPEAYQLYEPTPHARPTWDLTAVLLAVRPGRDYLRLSEPGRVTVGADAVTTFAPDPAGRDRIVLMPTGEERARILATFETLCSQPPRR